MSKRTKSVKIDMIKLAVPPMIDLMKSIDPPRIRSVDLTKSKDPKPRITSFTDPNKVYRVEEVFSSSSEDEDLDRQRFANVIEHAVCRVHSFKHLCRRKMKSTDEEEGYSSELLSGGVSESESQFKAVESPPPLPPPLLMPLPHPLPTVPEQEDDDEDDGEQRGDRYRGVLSFVFLDFQSLQ